MSPTPVKTRQPAQDEHSRSSDSNRADPDGHQRPAGDPVTVAIPGCEARDGDLFPLLRALRPSRNQLLAE